MRISMMMMHNLFYAYEKIYELKKTINIYVVYVTMQSDFECLTHFVYAPYSQSSRL